MKRLSLLLAFVLVVSCVLVACGDETETSSTPATESVAESSAVSTEESKEESVEASVEASTEESTEESVEESTEVSEEESKVEVTLGTLVSVGKSYTTTAPNRNDSFDDDGKKLTNGVKALADAGTNESAGWNNPDKTVANVVEIVVDLGEKMDTNAYVVYFAGGNWGINLPNGETGTSIEIFVSDSANGEFVSVASASGTDMELINGDGTSTEAWSTFSLTAGSAEAVNAQFVKFVLTAAPVGNSFIWIDEVEVYAPAE